MAEKRNVQRLRQRLQVRFQVKGVSATGFTENLGPGGILIHSNATFAPGSLVSGTLLATTGAEMKFDAEIRWVRKIAGPLGRVTKSSMGFRFIGAPDEGYFRLLAQKQSRGA